MKNTIFIGAATAIVTPFTNGEVDFVQFGKHIDWQIEQGINAIVVTGTTGEASTLTDEEHKEVMRYCVERVAGRVPATTTRSYPSSHLAARVLSRYCPIFYRLKPPKCVNYNRNGQVKESADLQLRYLDLIDALFCEVNPIPAKAAVSAMGFCENTLRLPLTPMEPAHEQTLLALMRKYQIIQ